MKQQLFDQEAVQEMATAVSLQGQLETIQRMMYLALGSVLTFLLFAFSNLNQIGREGFILWLLLFLGPPAISLLLLVSPTWRLLPLDQRHSPILHGLVISWLSLFVFYISSLSGGGPLWLRLFYLLFTAVYLLGVIGFAFFLRRRAMADPLFP